MDPLDSSKTDGSKVTHLASFDGLVPGWINVHNDIECSMYEFWLCHVLHIFSSAELSTVVLTQVRMNQTESELMLRKSK